MLIRSLWLCAAIFISLLLGCDSAPNFALNHWSHQDSWATRQSEISMQITVPEGINITDISLQFSRQPRGSQTNTPSDLYEDGAPGFTLSFDHNNENGTADLTALIKSREWGLGAKAEQLFFRTGDILNFSFLIHYQNTAGNTYSWYTPKLSYNFNATAPNAFRPSRGSDTLDAQELRLDSISISQIDDNIITSLDPIARNWNIGDEVMLIQMQAAKVRENNINVVSPLVGRYHIGQIANIEHNLQEDGSFIHTLHMCHAPSTDIITNINEPPRDGRPPVISTCRPMDINCCQVGPNHSVLDKVQMVRLRHFDDLDFQFDLRLRVPKWRWADSKGGIMALRANTITIQPNSSLQVDGAGFIGAGVSPNTLPGANGEGIAGPLNIRVEGSNGANGTALGSVSIDMIGDAIHTETGGRGAVSPCERWSPISDCFDGYQGEIPVVGHGGGGGGHGTAGQRGSENSPIEGFRPGNSGQAYFTPDLSKIFLGSGGGGGGGGFSGAAGSWNEHPFNRRSGAGGGIVFLSANTLTLEGTINANGLTGDLNEQPIDEETNRCIDFVDINRSSSGGAGGGAGGTIWLMAHTLIVGENASLTAIGGSNRCPVGGGDGGDGVIRLDFRFIETTTGQRFEEGTPEANALIERISTPNPIQVGRL